MTLPLNERFALKDIVESPQGVPYIHRETAYGQPGSMPALVDKGLVSARQVTVYEPTREGLAYYANQRLSEVNFNELYPARAKGEAA